MKRILVMPGTEWQVPLMKKIKSMGHKLFLINPEKNNGVYQIADDFFQSDIFDMEANLLYCKQNNIDAVITDECDIAVGVVSSLNEALGVQRIAKGTAELFTNKSLMRKFCKDHNLNPIPYRVCETKEDAGDFFEEYGPKIIIKPINSNSSHGVFSITSKQQIEKWFEESGAYSRGCSKVLAEKYIEGTEFTVDGIMTPNGHCSLAVSQKNHYSHNENIAKELFFSYDNTEYDYDLLRKINDNLLNKTGLKFGLTHVEYKFHDGKYYLIEMAARGGGNLISAVIVPYMSGIDTYEYLISGSVGKVKNMDITYNFYNERKAVLKFLDLPVKDGRIKKISGLEYMQQDPRIVRFHLNFEVGDLVQQPDSDSARIGYYIICAENETEYETVLENIGEKLKIIINN